PWVGLWGVFPEYRSRIAKVITLSERINDCFERSMNGKALAYTSDAMIAMLSYIQWLSTGVPTGQSVVGRGFKELNRQSVPDAASGKVLYLAKCVACHGADGEDGPHRRDASNGLTFVHCATPFVGSFG
ncbi:MAG: c-type cytochrome, partial [Actinomycetes bacterium]